MDRIELSYESIMRIRSLLFLMERNLPIVIRTTSLKGNDRKLLEEFVIQMASSCREIAKALDPIHSDFGNNG